MAGIDGQNVALTYQQVLRNLKVVFETIVSVKATVEKSFTETCVVRNEVKSQLALLTTEVQSLSTRLQAVEDALSTDVVPFLDLD